VGKSIFRKIFGLFSEKLNSADAEEKILSLIRYKIARGNIDDALGDLQQLTLKGILIPEPYLLEAKIYCENFDHEMKATRLIEYYFENPRLEIHSDNVKLLELYTSICADFHQQGKAVAFLDHELSKQGYSDIDREKLQACHDGIKTDDDSDGIMVKSHPAEASRNLKSVSNRTMFFSADDIE
jgi:hypothetical protein